MIHKRPPFPSGWSSIPITLANLTLANTLPVGQSFLWHRHPIPDEGAYTHPRSVEEYSRAVDNPPRVICLRQTSTHLYYTSMYAIEEAGHEDVTENGTKRWLEDYFHLKMYPDLPEMYAEWRRRDPGLFGGTDLDGRAIGVRVLRQDPWECLIAFITSTNNHIPRITSLMHRLSQRFSPPLLTLENPGGLGSTTYHSFPAPHLLPTQLDNILRAIGFGYRAKFIESSLATLRAQFGQTPGNIEAGLATWRTSNVDHVREKLLELKGVGRKVADCVMLMCLDQPALIPIDTHVAAIAARHPCLPSRLRNKPVSKQLYDDIQSFLLERWGPLGGWCQAVMFAAALPPTTTTPMNASARIKQAPSPTSPVSTVLGNPVDGKQAWPAAKLPGPTPKGRAKRHNSVDMPATYGSKRVRGAAYSSKASS